MLTPPLSLGGVRSMTPTLTGTDVPMLYIVDDPSVIAMVTCWMS